jgi:hypothetical protein
MLARIDETSADIAAVEAKIAELIAPFAQTVDRLDEIPGVGPTAAHVMIAEIGLDMSRFPTAAHLCSWARLAPGVKESAGKKKGRGSTGHGNPYLARVLGEAAVAAAKTDTFEDGQLPEQRPVGRGVHHHQPGDAHRGHRGEQRRHPPGRGAVRGRHRQHQHDHAYRHRRREPRHHGRGRPAQHRVHRRPPARHRPGHARQNRSCAPPP